MDGGRPHGVLEATVLDFNILVSVFRHLSRYYVHFRTNALGKGMNSLIPSNGLNSTTAAFQHGWIRH